MALRLFGYLSGPLCVVFHPDYSRFDITMTPWWVRWCLKSPASRLFAQPFVRAQTKEIIEAFLHWSLWGEPPIIDGLPSQRASYVENVSIWWRRGDFVDILPSFSLSMCKHNHVYIAVSLKRLWVIWENDSHWSISNAQQTRKHIWWDIFCLSDIRTI